VREGVRGVTKARRWDALLLSIVFYVVMAAPIVLSADTVTVSQRDRTFFPDSLQLAPGSVVHIVNDDKVTHHIYVDSPEMKFDSGEQPVGTTVDLRFDKPGTFDVQCAIHPTMHLQVTVK